MISQEICSPSRKVISLSFDFCLSNSSMYRWVWDGAHGKTSFDEFKNSISCLLSEESYWSWEASQPGPSSGWSSHRRPPVWRRWASQKRRRRRRRRRKRWKVASTKTRKSASASFSRSHVPVVEKKCQKNETNFIFDRCWNESFRHFLRICDFTAAEVLIRENRRMARSCGVLISSSSFSDSVTLLESSQLDS